jgi:hypothetical protein
MKYGGVNHLIKLYSVVTFYHRGTNPVALKQIMSLAGMKRTSDY